jgi:hypothetical protein
MLPTNSNINTSEYNLYLPYKSLLQHKAVEWTEEFGDAKTLTESELETEEPI